MLNIFFGLTPSLAGKVLSDTGIDMSTVVCTQQVHTLPVVSKEDSIVCCGLKYANALGIKGTMANLKGTTQYSTVLKRDVFITSSPNSYAHNANAIPEFVSSIAHLTKEDLGINYNPTYEVISTPSQLGLPDVSDDTVLAFDIESTGTHFNERMVFPMIVDKVLFAVFAYELDHSYMVESSDFTEHKELWQEFFNRTDIIFTMHNGKFDVKGMSIDLGLNLRCDFDTMMAHHRLSSDEKHKLKHLLTTLYGFTDYDSELDKYITSHPITGEKWFGDIPRDVFYPYAAMDGVGTLRLTIDLFEEMDKLGMISSFNRIDMPFINALAKNELVGRYVDMEYLMSKRKSTVLPAIQLHERDVQTIVRNLIATIGAGVVASELYPFMSKAGQRKPHKYVQELSNKFNVRSSKQLVMAFILLRMPDWKPKDGTAKPIVEKLETKRLNKLQREFLIAVIAFRTSEKIRSSYIDNMIKMVDNDSRVYPTYNPTGTKTYRTNAKIPAIQTIPKTTLGSIIRSAFVVQGDEVILKFDGQGSQLHIAGSRSRDPVMLKVFSTPDGDLHQTTLDPIYQYLPNILQDEPDMARGIAKQTNFTLLFGGGLWTLRSRMPFVDEKVLKLMYESFRQTYHVYIRWSDEQVYKARTTLRLTNQFGYARVWSGLNRQIDNQARNFEITSLEAQVMNASYARITNLGVTVGLHLHDELQMIATHDTYTQIAQKSMTIMLEEYQRIGLNVSWGVDGSSLLRWKPLNDEDTLRKYEMHTEVGVKL